MNNPKVSIVILAFKEPNTIGKAMESFLDQDIKADYELIVSAPDKETQDIVKKYKKVKLFEDPGKGKSYALNLVLKNFKRDILIMTDGDVYAGENSVNEIVEEFKDPKVGCVTGKPVPMEDKKTKYGYWANFLFDAAHRLRQALSNQGRFIQCSGYLYALKNNIITSFPLDVADDAIIPHLISLKGYKVAYARNAKVYVKNVNNWKDWANQKIRTSKSHSKIQKYVNTRDAPKTKTFSNEVRGIFYLFFYFKNPKEFFWTFELIFARLYMWFMVFFDNHIKKKYYGDNWERVQSTRF